MQSRQLAGAMAGVAMALAAAGAEAAVVRDLHVQHDASVTRVVLDIDGVARYRAHASEDGSAIYVDLDDSTLSDEAPRVLPVFDRRVDGVMLRSDDAARVVRVAIDVAGPVAPRLVPGRDGSRLVLDLVESSIVQAGAGLAKSTDQAPAQNEQRSARASDGKARSKVPDSRELRAAKLRALARRAPSPGASPVGVASSSAKVAAYAPGGRASAAASRRSVVEKPVVVLDPGHGGRDPGARAWTGEVEKDIVLDLAERVARRLRARGDVEVVMTRSGDEYVELADRRDTSRRWAADVFVSIHANASHNAAARGIETYYHSRSTSDRDMRRLARAENRGRTTRAPSSRRAAVSPASLARSTPPVLDRRSESIRLARLVQEELVRQLGMRYEAVRDLGAKEGPFFVIGDNAAPSVLVEAAFLTHREEGLRMRSEVYREQIADGVSRGILLFLDQQRRSGTL